MESRGPLPFYAKFSLNLLTIVIIGAMIYLGQSILMPICFAIVLAFLLLPANNWLVKKGFPQVASMLLSIFIAVALISALVYFLSSQVAGFIDDLPKIKQNLSHHLSTVQQWVRDNFNVSRRDQQKAVDSAAADIRSTGPGMLGSTVLSAASAIIVIVLLPIYTFLILYYRQLIKRFFVDIFAERHRSKVEEVLFESRIIIQSYMVGLLLEMAIVTVLNWLGFFIIGIHYAIFLALLAAILNMIPYIGMLIAGITVMIITLTSSNHLADVIWVAVALTIVQFIDNNILMPYVVSSKVKINALVSIIGVLVGGAIAGVSGMFLSIPGIAIMKSIFDRVDELKPWGMILGDDRTTSKPTIRQRIHKIKKQSIVKK